MSQYRHLARYRDMLIENLACKRSQEENSKACETKSKILIIQFSNCFTAYYSNIFIYVFLSQQQANTKTKQCTPSASTSQETGKLHWRNPSWEVIRHTYSLLSLLKCVLEKANASSSLWTHCWSERKPCSWQQDRWITAQFRLEDRVCNYLSVEQVNN